MKLFDYIVVGGGSGGIASARRAAAHGAQVALVEARRIGGTCVNLGCVPKKMMFNAASIAETLEDASSYGFAGEPGRFDWGKVKAQRDAAVTRLVEIYTRNLQASGVTTVSGRAKLTLAADAPGGLMVEVDGERFGAPHVLLAMGGYPRVPNVAGAQLGITSNGFFELETQPKRVVVIGAGYIGVELAGILRALGSAVTLLARHQTPLTPYDPMVQEELVEHMTNNGIEFVGNAEPERVTRSDNGRLKVSSKDGREFADFDTLIWSVGRVPATAGLGLDGAGINLDAKGFVEVDAQQNTTRAGVYAVGDVTGKVPLTPVAIAAGRALADRLFAQRLDAAIDYDNVPTVVFSHPPIGAVGLTEPAARERFGDDIAVFKTRFTNLFHALTKHRPKTAMKLVTQASTGKVLGIHVIGRAADEMIQGFAVALHMGATKADFDRTIAIHPTAAEELVTLR
jgi:glutathione reductase (NADPH)